MKLNTLILTAGLLAVFPLAAQTTTTHTKTITAEVVAVHGQKLVYKLDGKILEAQIPETVRFDVNGKQLTLGELEPGSTVTATITTKTKVIPGDTVITVKNAEVMYANGRTVILKDDKGEMKKHTMPGDYTLMVDGKKTSIYKVKKGMKVTATFTDENPPVTVTEKDMTAMATAPVKPEPVPEPVAAPVAPAKLPKTGSHLPLLGLLGLLSMGAGAGLRRLRRS